MTYPHPRSSLLTSSSSSSVVVVVGRKRGSAREATKITAAARCPLSLLVDTPPHDNPACLLAAHVRWRGWMALLERGASLRSTTLPWLSVPDR